MSANAHVTVVQVAIFGAGLLVALYPVVYLPLTKGAVDPSEVRPQ